MVQGSSLKNRSSKGGQRNANKNQPKSKKQLRKGSSRTSRKGQTFSKQRKQTSSSRAASLTTKTINMNNLKSAIVKAKDMGGGRFFCGDIEGVKSLKKKDGKKQNFSGRIGSRVDKLKK